VEGKPFLGYQMCMYTIIDRYKAQATGVVGGINESVADKASINDTSFSEIVVPEPCRTVARPRKDSGDEQVV